MNGILSFSDVYDMIHCGVCLKFESIHSQVGGVLSSFHLHLRFNILSSLPLVIAFAEQYSADDSDSQKETEEDDSDNILNLLLLFGSELMVGPPHVFVVEFLAFVGQGDHNYQC